MTAFLTRDGETVTVFEYEDLFSLEMKALRYIHQHHPYSFDHALRWEGYSLVDENNEILIHPYSAKEHL